jgi:hypothetical protein
VAEGQDFRVGGGVLILFAAIGGFGDHLVVTVYNHGSHGHVASGSGGFGEFKGTKHPMAVAQVFGVIEGRIGDIVRHDRFWTGDRFIMAWSVGWSTTESIVGARDRTPLRWQSTEISIKPGIIAERTSC